MSDRAKMGRSGEGRLSQEAKAELDLSDSPTSTSHAAASSHRHRQAYSATSDTSNSFFNDALVSDQSRSSFESSNNLQQAAFAALSSQVDSTISEGRSQATLSKEVIKSSQHDSTSRYETQTPNSTGHRLSGDSFSRSSVTAYQSNAAPDHDLPQYQAPHPYLRHHSAFQTPFISAPQMERGRNHQNHTSDFNTPPAPLTTASYRYPDSNSAPTSRSSSSPSAASASSSASLHIANDTFSSQLYASRSPFSSTSISMPNNPFFQQAPFQASPFPAQGPYGASAASFSGSHFGAFPHTSTGYPSSHPFSPSSQLASSISFPSNSSLSGSGPSTHSQTSNVSSSMPHHSSSIGYSWPSRFEDGSMASNDDDKMTNDDRRYAYDLPTDDISSLAPPPKRPYDGSSNELYHQNPSIASQHSSSTHSASKLQQGASPTVGRRRSTQAAPSRDSNAVMSRAISEASETNSSRSTATSAGRTGKGKRSSATVAASSSTTSNSPSDSKKRTQASSSASPAASQSPETPTSSSSTPSAASRPAVPSSSATSSAASASSPDVISASLPHLGALGADPEARAAVVNAIATIRRSFESAHVLINGTRTSVLALPHESSHLRIETQPQEYQVKDFNVLPTLVVQVCNPPRARNCDHVAAFLYCDEHLHIDDAFFLAALNARHAPNGELHFNNLRISKEMLHGRTKGFSFVIGFSYITNKGETVDTVYTTPFWLFSNVNQEGFPKAARDSILRPQWRDSSSNFATQKRKR